MNLWSFEQIAGACGGRVVQSGGKSFSGRVVKDSREVQAGDLFIAIVGKNHDAHDFLGEVIAAGAGGIIMHRPANDGERAAANNKGCWLLETDNTVAGLNRLAAAYRQTLRAKVIAVGGSNGKTTTKRIIDAVLGRKMRGVASPRSFNNNIGLPLTLLEAHANHDYVVLEIGTNAPGEIAALAVVARPDVAVITSIGLEHLEKLGDLAGVAREEAAISEFLRPGGVIILPGDAPELLAALAGTEINRITVGPGGNLWATEIKQTLEGSWFAINGGMRFRLPLLGMHNVANALLAIAVGRWMGIADAAIQAGLAGVKPAEMRLELVNVGTWMVLNDAYNANPSSMERALETLAALAGGEGRRKVAVLGDMLELGGASEMMHRQIGIVAAAHGVELLVAVGPAMRAAAQAAQSQGVTAHWFTDTAQTGREIGNLLKPGDAILLKGSRRMAMENMLESLRPRAAMDLAAC